MHLKSAHAGQERQPTGTFKASASFAIVSGVPEDSPFGLGCHPYLRNR